MTTQNPTPNDLFNMLAKEAAAKVPAGDQQQQTQSVQTDTTKIASAEAVVMNKEWFSKVASNDPVALGQMHAFVQAASAEGHTADEIAATIGELEAEAKAEGTAAGAAAAAKTASDQPAGGTDVDDGEDDEFELAKAEAEDEAINKAIDDELGDSPIAKLAGVTREDMEQWLIGEAAGGAYYEARLGARDLVQKIASMKVPDDSLVDAAIKEAKAQGLDTTELEAKVAEVVKQASVAVVTEDTPAVKIAREAAEAESALVESLSVLKIAGYDVDALVKQAEEKKKMSTGKKALIGGAGLAAAVGGGMLAKRHLGNKAKALGEAVSYKMLPSKA